MLRLKRRKIKNKNQLSKDLSTLFLQFLLAKTLPGFLCSIYPNRLILRSITGTKTFCTSYIQVFINFTLEHEKATLNAKLLELQCWNFLCQCLLLNSKDCMFFRITSTTNLKLIPAQNLKIGTSYMENTKAGSKPVLDTIFCLCFHSTYGLSDLEDLVQLIH